MITFAYYLLVGLFTILLMLLKTLFSSPAHRHSNLPKGSMGWPFIGETSSFLDPHESTSLGRFLEERCSRYGKVFKSHLFGSPTIVSCDHEFNQFVLQNEEKLFQASFPNSMRTILGDYSVLISTADLHKKLRNGIISFISAAKSAATFHRISEQLTRSMLRSWEGLNEVSFQIQAKSFTLNVMLKILLNIEPDDPRAARMLQNFLTYPGGFGSLALNIPGTPYAMALKAKADLCSIVKEIIKERKSRAETDEGDEFLDVIVTKDNLSEEEQVSQVLDILHAGYETPATLLSLIVYFLGHAPLALHQLKEEHDTVRRNKENMDQPLNHEDYKQMEFTNNVILEALRYGNAINLMHRQATQDIQFKGYFIPSGWKVLPITAGPYLDPTFHESPHEFNPWRWKNDETKKKLMSFGGGPRLCPGGDLAKLVIASFLHHLVLNYKWKAKEDEAPIAYPNVEFKRGLVLEIQKIGRGSADSSTLTQTLE